MYYSDDDMLEKIEYYMSHNEERKKIAANGQKKVAELYDYMWRGSIYSVSAVSHDYE